MCNPGVSYHVSGDFDYILSNACTYFTATSISSDDRKRQWRCIGVGTLNIKLLGGYRLTLENVHHLPNFPNMLSAHRLRDEGNCIFLSEKLEAINSHTEQFVSSGSMKSTKFPVKILPFGHETVSIPQNTQSDYTMPRGCGSDITTVDDLSANFQRLSTWLNWTSVFHFLLKISYCGLHVQTSYSLELPISWF